MSRYYKVIGADNKSCHGGDFDWTAYLPKGKKPGKWTPKIENIAACERGYHVTKYWNMWYEAGCRIFECEVDGVVVTACESVVGVVDKVVCTRIRLCKEITPQFDSDRNTGNYNTGNRNTGYRNTGQRNTGQRNTGNYNVGDCNTGDYNTGRYNTGDCNTGDCNTGGWNTGDCNTGGWNTGDCNTGYSNTGNYNTGYSNTGNYNTGYSNTGSWNICDRSSGFFNTVNDTINVFNKPCKIATWEAANKPSFICFAPVGTYKESWRKAYDGASDEDKLLLVELPNFNAKVFYEISGIMVDPKTGKEVI
jgi:hypothetical protein